ncbi:DEAD/DEAH box helicase [Terrilactibacillus sp. S3-3]|nr:DEAD/DEAH box helicase [Terrilactibacillus sp. S3-3]
MPIIAKIAEKNGFLPLQALIAAPTRELAGQIAAVAVLLIPEQAVAVLYGGHSMDAEVDSLKQRPSLIVGTPGRLCDHLNRGTLSCSTMRCLVLDEADEMLQMGFKDEIAALLTQFPKIGQRAFFSATLPRKMAQWAADALNNPVSIIIDRQTSDTAGIKQLLFETSDREKFNVLCTIISPVSSIQSDHFLPNQTKSKKAA